MATKVHFNPSTQKVAFNETTKKVQVFDHLEPGVNCVCFPSGETPKYYTLEFSGVTMCEGFEEWDFNGIHILTQTNLMRLK